jgi:hypothetical protein
MTQADRVHSTPPTDTPVLSEALALVERCRKVNRRWDVLYNKLNNIEEEAQVQHGRRPIALITWRDYSAIGCGGIELARDDYIRRGVRASVVQAEYRLAKRRYCEAVRAGDDWDRKAGLTDLRKEYEDNRLETCAAWKALGKVTLTSIRDAAAVIGVLRERMRKFD